MRTASMIRWFVLIGSIITIGFGIWHFTVPWLYQWFDYMGPIPEELKNGINATNFFLSLALLILGIQSLFIVIYQWDNLFILRLNLSVMSILWTARTIYQIIVPQGTMIPGLSIIMLIIFIIMAISFILPLIFVCL